MKKKFTLLLCVVLCLSLIAGCGKKVSPEQAYIDKSFAMLQWPGVTDTTTADLKIQFPDQPFVIDYSITMESEQIPSTSATKMTISAVSNNELPNIDPFAVYTDGVKIYVETAAVKKIGEAFNLPLPAEIAAAAEEYLLYDSSAVNQANLDGMPEAYAELYQSMLEDPVAFYTDFINKFFAANPDFTLGMKQNGNNFTLKIDNQNIFAVTDGVILSLIKNAKAIVDILPLQEEDKAQITPVIADTAALKKQYEQQRDALQAMIQAQIDTGTFTLDTDVTLNSADYTGKYLFEMNYPTLADISLNMAGSGKKADGIQIEMPASFKDISQALQQP